MGFLLYICRVLLIFNLVLGSVAVINGVPFGWFNIGVAALMGMLQASIKADKQQKRDDK